MKNSILTQFRVPIIDWTSIPSLVALTGGIGSGKSTVAKVFADRGAKIIEGDILGKQVVDESEQFRSWLESRYGSRIFRDGILNRAELGRIVFSDVKSREDLDQAIWPFIKEKLKNSIREVIDNNKVAVVDAALIFEWNDSERYDLIITVLSDRDTAVKRAAERTGLTVEEMNDRWNNQIDPKEKAQRSDIVIKNDGSIDDLRANANSAWNLMFQHKG